MVSIIIPTVGSGGRYLQKLLPILKKEPDTEVIVVDNLSNDNTEEICRVNGARYVKNTCSYPFSISCNIGVTYAKGEYILFLNNDTVPPSGFTGFLVGKINEQENIGAVGVKLVFDFYPDRVQHAGIVFNELGYPFEYGANESTDSPNVNQEREMNAVTGACLFTKRTVVDEIGGFDECYINGWEDTTMCLKIRERGYKILYTAGITIRHVHMGSLSEGRLRTDDYNRELYKMRWMDTGRVWKIIGRKK